MYELIVNPLFIQSLGWIALIFSLLVFQVNKRDNMLKLHLYASLFYSVHFFLLGGYSGAAVNLVNALRNYSFFKVSKKREGWILPIFFIALFIAVVLLSWQGWISLLPMIGAICGTLAFWQKSPKWIRIFSLFVAPSWFLYAALIGSYPMMISEIIMFSSDVVGLFRFNYPRISNKFDMDLHYKRKLHP
jgi:hypothetical protein